MIDRWGWFDALVARSAAPRVVVPSAALADAILWLGLHPSQLVCAVGCALGVPASRMADPDPRDVARIDGRRLAAVVPALLVHEGPEIRALGKRWLTDPVAAYQIPVATLERWLAASGPCGDVLQTRVADEGLSLLGPSALGRLASASTRGPVRAAAQRWLDRLGR